MEFHWRVKCWKVLRSVTWLWSFRWHTLQNAWRTFCGIIGRSPSWQNKASASWSNILVWNFCCVVFKYGCCWNEVSWAETCLRVTSLLVLYRLLPRDRPSCISSWWRSMFSNHLQLCTSCVQSRMQRPCVCLSSKACREDYLSNISRAQWWVPQEVNDPCSKGQTNARLRERGSLIQWPSVNQKECFPFWGNH